MNLWVGWFRTIFAPGGDYIEVRSNDLLPKVARELGQVDFSYMIACTRTATCTASLKS